MAPLLGEQIWGQGFPEPRFCNAFRVESQRVVGERHLKLRLSKEGRIVNGQGADTDIVVASAKAYINALNKLHSKLERVNPQV